MKRPSEFTELDVAFIKAVLLSDGWHTVTPGTLKCDLYVLVRGAEDSEEDYGDDDVQPFDIPFSEDTALRISWEEPDGSRVYAPLRSVIALKQVSQTEIQENLDRLMRGPQ
jgi:hypothetical protein